MKMPLSSAAGLGLTCIDYAESLPERDGEEDRQTSRSIYLERHAQGVTLMQGLIEPYQ